jgi:hypothetical protein
VFCVWGWFGGKLGPERSEPEGLDRAGIGIGEGGDRVGIGRAGIGIGEG